MFEYLVALDISKVDLRKIPTTQWKRDLKLKSLTPLIESVLAIIRLNLESTESVWSVTEFYEQYQTCDANHKSAHKLKSTEGLTLPSYSKKLQNLLDQPTKQREKAGRRRQSITITIPELQALMKKVLKDPDWDFSFDPYEDDCQSEEPSFGEVRCD